MSFNGEKEGGNLILKVILEDKRQFKLPCYYYFSGITVGILHQLMNKMNIPVDHDQTN
ncbi:hypothetical protein [Maribacter sp. HTCC2170]|uniref:hypothetical protein n=1 Tax=Maribacter sp. (strain HTCC2170 / KCCM 42371) TaxID=313603 RepID=UPI00006AFC90|nr:hypothetical protein [Maribacter sp. HTCC2170]EAR01303.1 hypothetical protein FB2170_11301 [Maribacter sp. HTCC2170]